MTREQKRALKAADDRVNAAYLATCAGVQISILDIPKVFAAGRAAIAAGADTAALQAAVRDYVETIRKN